MAEHDYVIDNQSAPSFRTDLNNALLAIVSQNSKATAPTTTYANMIWYDTTNNQIKKRNEANSAWITLGTVDEGAGTFTPNSAITVSEIAASTLVTSSETIASNNNNTTIPTSAAVKAYTDAAISAIPSPSSVLLGTLSTTSGTSQTLSGLNLTSYKFVRFFMNGISANDTGAFISFGNYRIATINATFVSDAAFGSGVIDLATGVFASSSGVYNGTSIQSAAGYGGLSGVTNSSTSITFNCSAGDSFDAGSIRIYGVF